MPGSVALGLNGIADYGASQPFIDVLKAGREWQGRSPGAYISHTTDQLRAGGHLDADGHPFRLPAAGAWVGTIILTEMAAADTSLNGRYRLEFTGNGDLHIHGAQNITRGQGFAEFDYRAQGGNLVALEITRFDAANPLKLRSCINLRHRAAFEAGEIFRPEWLDLIKDFRLFRFMDWQATNNSPLSAWADRPTPSSATWVNGVPVEVMVALCNKLGVDGWFCYPHLANDDYITRFAQYVRANLRPGLVAYYEFSNEVWNFQFEQAQWANRQALALWPDYQNQDGWMQFYGGRAAEMASLLDVAYAGATGYRKVITTHTAWQGLEDGILNAPRWVRMQAGRQAPKEHFDCYAVTGYFGHGLSYADGAARLRGWMQQGEAHALREMRTALDGEIGGLIGQWRYQKAVADAAGLSLVMYEGGSHIVPNIGSDDPLFPFLERFHYSADMAALYTRAMTGFRDVGGEAFNVFVEISSPGRHGFWGARRHLLDDNPRWDAITAFNAGNAAPVPVPVDPIPDPAPVDPDPEPTPVDPVPVNPAPVDPVEPEPTDPPEETPAMPDIAKLRSEIAAMLSNTAANIDALLAEAGVTPAPVDPAPVEPAPVDPAPVDPTPPAVPGVPIWTLSALPVLDIPSEVIVPPGTQDIYIPVAVDQCEWQSFMAYCNRLVNVNGGGINVGNGLQARERFHGLDVVYHWSPGDDPLHWVKISPQASHGDGRAFQASIRVKGLGDKQKGRTVTIRFVEGAEPQQITEPFHRPLRRLDLSGATRSNTFDPSTLKWSPNGRDAQGNAVWMSALSHGRAQIGNDEDGLYADETIAKAVNPISYDPAENAIRLHTRGFVGDDRPEWDNRLWDYQAAVLQGLHKDDVCGAEGVWRMEAKIPNRRYSWPAFWLVNRVQNSRGVWENRWPGEIDILEKFNGAWGAADTPYTSSFAQHYGPLGDWQKKAGQMGYEFDVHQYGAPRVPLDEVYTSWACHVRYDDKDTTKSEVTFFVNDLEVGCQVLHARHQDMNRKVQFYPIFNVAVRDPGTNDPAGYNADPRTGDMWVRDVGYWPTGARMVAQ